VLISALVGVMGPASGQPSLPPGHQEAADAPSDDTTTTTSCNVLEQLLNMCASSTTTTTPPPSTTAPDPTTTTPPPTTTAPDPTTTSTAPAGSASRDSGGGSDQSTCSDSTPPVAAPSGTWSCTFDDEFNGSSLDTSQWQPMLTADSGYMTGPLLSQACYVDNPQTINESGGTLNLSVVDTGPVTCDTPASWLLSTTTDYEAGMVDTSQLFSQQYGYFEVRAELPPATVQGLQETLWLYPEDGTLYGAWPDSGEIDFGEFYSEYPDLDVPADHFPGSGSDSQASSDGCSQAAVTTAGQFNTYAVLWTPTTIETYFNGVPCTVDDYGPYVTAPDTAPEPFNQPFFLAFTAALGTNTNSFEPGTTPLPATTRIDWVRVWQYS
jgi:beta-glucanase (GH16 family)